MALFESWADYFTPLKNAYHYVLVTKKDPRTDEWLLVRSPGPMLTILITYIYFCTKFGPYYMRDRKPYQLKYTLMTYNAFQVLLSIFLFYEGLAAGWFSTYKFKCQPIDWTNDPLAIRMAGATWWYYMAKLTELLDTVFFVLRKKNNQVTFLHIYHHFMMPICSWIGIKFLPGGHGTLLGLINSFIHIFMYSYYFIASLGPKYQKHLWWKRHLTELQILQFIIVFVHQFQVLFRECDFPKVINILLSIQAAFFMYLFSDFYVEAYWSKNSRMKLKEAEENKKKKILSQENNNTKNEKLKEH